MKVIDVVIVDGMVLRRWCWLNEGSALMLMMMMLMMMLFVLLMVLVLLMLLRS